jgi:hypothetical protein
VTLFETETIADLMWEQGHGEEAIALCGRLAARAREPERQRLLAKAETWQRALAGRSARPPMPGRSTRTAGGFPIVPPPDKRRSGDTANDRTQVDAPATAGSPDTTAGTASVTLRPTTVGLTLAWSLPAGTSGRATSPPSAELFLVRRTPEGLDVQRRTLPLGAMQGTVDLPVAELHSARAAVGFLETDGFRPLARSSLLQAPAPRADPSSSR